MPLPFPNAGEEREEEEGHTGEAVGLIDIAPELPPLCQGELPHSQTWPWDQLWWQVTPSRKEEHSDLIFSF